MDEAPSPSVSTPKEQFSESIEIKQEDNIYKLNIEVINQNITLNILEEKELMNEYELILTLNEIKQKHKIFSVLESFKGFIEIIKESINKQKLSIKIIDEKRLELEIIAEYFFRKDPIQFEIKKKQINFELITKNLYNKISILRFFD